MKIYVKAKAGAKEDKITPPPLKLLKTEDDVQEYFVVSVKELPRQGKANKAIKKLLAEYFNTPLSQVILLKGETSKIKVFEIKN